jgi:hypothetical protein
LHLAVHADGTVWTAREQVLRGQNIIWLPPPYAWDAKSFGSVVFAALLSKEGTDLRVLSNRPRESGCAETHTITGLELWEEDLIADPYGSNDGSMLYGAGMDIRREHFEVTTFGAQAVGQLAVMVTNRELQGNEAAMLQRQAPPLRHLSAVA